MASPAGHHDHHLPQPQKLKRPTANVGNGRAYFSSSCDQDEPRVGGGGSDSKHGNSMGPPGQQQNNGRAGFAVYSSRGGLAGANVADLMKLNRKLNLKIKVCACITSIQGSPSVFG